MTAETQVLAVGDRVTDEDCPNEFFGTVVKVCNNPHWVHVLWDHMDRPYRSQHVAVLRKVADDPS